MTYKIILFFFLISNLISAKICNTPNLKKIVYNTLELYKHYTNWQPNTKVTKLHICIDDKYFFQITGGYKYSAIYNRLNNTIYLRSKYKNKDIIHEVGHAFLLNKKLKSLQEEFILKCFEFNDKKMLINSTAIKSINDKIIINILKQPKALQKKFCNAALLK